MTRRRHGSGERRGRLVLALMFAGACVDRKVEDNLPEAPEHEFTCAQREYRSAAEEALAAGLYDACERDEDCAFAEVTTACRELCERQVVNRSNQEGFATKIAAIDETYCANYLVDGCSSEPASCAEESRVPACEAGHCTAIVAAGCQSDASSTILRAELFKGDCAEDCANVLVMEELAGPCDRVALTLSNFDAATPNHTVHGKLTPRGLTMAQRLASKLEDVPLEDAYPCPNCADMSGMKLTLRRQDVESSHTYDPNAGHVPEVLDDANTFVLELFFALSECLESELVVPADCRRGN